MITPKTKTGEEKNEINHVIHTYESDAYAAIKNKKLDGIHIHALETDSKNGIAENIVVENNQNLKKKIIILAGTIFTLLAIVVVVYFYTRPKPVVVINAPAKIYTVYDTWPQIGTALDSYTDYSTSTDTYIKIHISDFDSMYAYIINNEAVFTALAREKWSLGMLGAFKDVSVQNHDLRIADGSTGPVVYGYAGKENLIIANSVENWVAAFDK